MARSRTLDRSGRRILLRALFGRLDPILRRPFEAVADRPGFIESLVRVLQEIRAESGPDASAWLATLQTRTDLSNDLRAKLATIAALRRAYDEALTTRGLRDPEMLLLDAPARIAARPELFRGRSIIVDGFLSFTRMEREILAAIGQAGAYLTITICVDPGLAEMLPELTPMPPRCRIDEWPGDFARRVDRPVFLAPLRTLAEVRARIHAAGLSTRLEALDGTPWRFRSEGLLRLEAGLLRRPEKKDAQIIQNTPADVEMLAARDPSHEVEIWAHRIDRWIRLEEDAIRPGEIAIVVRDLETYRPIVEETFARFHIPVFVDRHWDISSRPIVRTILDALEVINSGWQRESVIAFLRSPLLGARGGEVDILENLSLEAGNDFDQWTGEAWQPLRRPPRTRFVRGGEERTEDAASEAPETEADEEEKSDAVPEPEVDEREAVRTSISNRLRTQYLEPLRLLEGRLRKPGLDGRGAVTELRTWIAVTGIETREGDVDQKREVEAVEHVLDQIAVEIAEGLLPPEEFARMLAAGLGSLQLGRTPTRLDTVTLAEVQRSRLGEVRRAIVGGLSARDFPRPVTTERFFNDRERAELARLGLDLGPADPLRQEAEGYFLYIAVTRAAERLVLTRPTTDIEGSSLDPSPFLDEIRAALPGLEESFRRRSKRTRPTCATRKPRKNWPRAWAPTSPRVSTAGSRGAAASRNRSAPTRTTGGSSPSTTGSSFHPPGWAEEAPRFLRETSRLWGYDNRPALPPEIVRLAIRDRRLEASVSRLESFARCPYQHFARSMLRLQRRPEAEVTPLEGGLLTHKALEILLQQGAPRRSQRDRAPAETGLRVDRGRPEPAGLRRHAGRPPAMEHGARAAARASSRSRPGGWPHPSSAPTRSRRTSAPPRRDRCGSPSATARSFCLRGRIDRIDVSGEEPD